MDLQAFFDQLLSGDRLGRAPGLGTGGAGSGHPAATGVQPTSAGEGLRALMGTAQHGGWAGSTQGQRNANLAATDQLNANAPGSLFAGLFDDIGPIGAGPGGLPGGQPPLRPWTPPSSLTGGDGANNGLPENEEDFTEEQRRQAVEAMMEQWRKSRETFGGPGGGNN